MKQCPRIASRGSSLKEEIEFYSTEFLRLDQHTRETLKSRWQTSQPQQRVQQQHQPQSVGSSTSIGEPVRTGDQDRSKNNGDTLASKPSSIGKPVWTNDDEATKPSEKEIDLRMDGVPQEEILSDRKHMEIWEKIAELKDESKSRSMQEDLQRGNLLSEETRLKILQMRKVEIHDLRQRKDTMQCPLCSEHVSEGLQVCKCGAGLQLHQTTVQMIKQKFLLLLGSSYYVPVVNKGNDMGIRSI